jgi:hypothetical protein
MNTSFSLFDIIGDVHGCASKLEELLRRLGYRARAGAYRHPERTAVFVGDLIDRGPQQLETVDLVRRMVDSGTACMVLGNHELNALGWVTPDPARPGEFLRRRLGGKGEVHYAQHRVFLEQVGEGSPRHREALSWFRTLPLVLDLGSIRVAHACWDRDSVERLTAAAPRDGVLSEEWLVALFDKSTPLGEAMQVVVKGPEYALKEEHAYLDKDGNPRHKARHAWWSPEGSGMGRALVLPGGSLRLDGTPHPGFPDDPLLTPPVPAYQDRVPAFFGHYWFTGDPAPLSDALACVDYSAVKGGPLVAYRFSGEPTLRRENFLSVV